APVAADDLYGAAADVGDACPANAHSLRLVQGVARRTAGAVAIRIAAVGPAVVAVTAFVTVAAAAAVLAAWIAVVAQPHAWSVFPEAEFDVLGGGRAGSQRETGEGYRQGQGCGSDDLAHDSRSPFAGITVAVAFRFKSDFCRDWIYCVRLEQACRQP